VEAETIVLVGGPLDGMTEVTHEGALLLVMPVDDGAAKVVHHHYGPADFLDPDAESFNSRGERRYVYLGEGPDPE
jgi:hypothetical protein